LKQKKGIADRVKSLFGRGDPALRLQQEFNVNKPETVSVQSAPQVAPAGGPSNRQHARHEVELEVTLYSEHNFYNGFSENIGEGGIFVATHDPLPMGETVALDFTLPSGHRIKVSCEVCWLRDQRVIGDATPGMGLRFSDLADYDRFAIEEFLAQREPLFHDDDLES